MKTNLLLKTITLLLLSLFILSCSDDDNGSVIGTENNFKSLTSPYLICAGRNPGGVGFDFLYKNNKGGANNMDKLTVNDFKYDILIRTVKGEKPDGSLGGAPYIKLSENVTAINYSQIDTVCKGYNGFKNLTKINIKNYTAKTDQAGFNLSGLKQGSSGKPLMKDLQKEYSKLVIGQKWKFAAHNNIANDEAVWVIKTKEGRIVKFIVTDFPASPAPTATGYIAIEWDFVN